MNVASQLQNRRVLIASNHALFAQGLRSLLRERQAEGVEVVGVVSNLDEAMAALDKLHPDLIIVDYDDDVLNRDEFLARFVEGEGKLRVVLLSLQGGSEALVYDRRWQTNRIGAVWLTTKQALPEFSRLLARQTSANAGFEFTQARTSW